MTEHVHINPATHIPLRYDITWDFSKKIDSKATGFLVRRSDRHTVPVIMDFEEDKNLDISTLFPFKEGEVSDPNEIPTM